MEKSPNPQLPKFMSWATLSSYLWQGSVASVLSQEDDGILWKNVKKLSPPIVQPESPFCTELFRPSAYAMRSIQKDDDVMEKGIPEVGLTIIKHELQSPLLGGITWMAAVQNEFKKLFICFRGSETLKDWAVNVDFERTSLNAPFNFHRGMFREVFPHYITKIRPFVFHFIADNDGYEIVFCGHSLGGAYATICSILLNADLYYDYRSSFSPSCSSCSCSSSSSSPPPSSPSPPSSSPIPIPSSSSSSLLPSPSSHSLSPCPTSSPPSSSEIASSSSPLSSTLFSSPSLFSLSNGTRQKMTFFSPESQKLSALARGRNFTKKCVTFGSPQVIFSKLSLPDLFSVTGEDHPMLYFTDFTQHHHFVNDRDIVPRLLGQNPDMGSNDEIEYPGKYKTVGNVYLISPHGDLFDVTDFSECILSTDLALQRGFKKSFDDHKTRYYYHVFSVEMESESDNQTE